MNTKILAQVVMVFVAVVAIVVVVAHMSCIWLGPACFKAQMAPSMLVQSSIDGTWIAPVGTVVVSILFFICAMYALSGAQLIRKLPLLSIGIYVIGIICLIRAVIIVPFLYRHPEARDVFVVVSATVWFICGLFLIFGYRHLKSESSH